MEKDELPKYTPVDEHAVSRRQRIRRIRRVVRTAVLVLVLYAAYNYFNPQPVYTRVDNSRTRALSISKLEQGYAQCAKLRTEPKDPSGPREINARWNGSKSTLIRNTTIWTGEPVDGKFQWIHGDVLLERGLVAKIGEHISLRDVASDVKVHDGSGKMLTAGIIDMHSHAGDESLPSLKGSSDGNELSSDTTPYVRSLDAINPLDPQLQVIKSGGVTTSLILPGSGNNIGGEAFVVKHAVGKANGRPEISAEDMLADPEHNWRYMKMACGENAKRVYGRVGRDFGPFSRMGEAWYFRHAFEQAQTYNQAQDDWCAAADQVGAENMQEYLPQSLEWESLGAVLRGQVHVNTHCYTVPDLEAFIRHTNEFKFPVRAFHHAHQTYLVPEILKRNFGGRPPAAALFADNMYYKTESYIGSEQAGKILHENGITPVYVSDNPVLNGQHVVFEAAKAFKNGLPYHVALAGVTSASAELLGLGERIGKVKAGFDADIALWDSDPLSVGATPVQVWIDGQPQFEDAVELKKPAAEPVETFNEVASSSEEPQTLEDVVFTGVTRILLPDHEQALSEPGNVVVKAGVIACIGSCSSEIAALDTIPTIHLQNGHLVPPATAFGSFLGIEEISAEPSTNDGGNNANSFSPAALGLQLDSKSLRAAYAHGVANAISAPAFHKGGHKGSSVGFRVKAKHSLEKGAVWQSVVAAHYPLHKGAREGDTPSSSSAVAALELNLLKALNDNETEHRDPDVERADLFRVVTGDLPLVVDVHKADTIAAIIKMKEGIDSVISDTALHSRKNKTLRMVIWGGAEAHIVAPELAAAGIAVVLAPAFPYSETWEQRRSLTGAPLTNGTAIDILHAAGVKLALGTAEDWQTRDLYLYAGMAHINSGGAISEKQALGLISGNIYDMLGLEEKSKDLGGWIVSDGSPMEIPSRVRAVCDGSGKVDVWV